jgi:hypothetical protein
MSNDIPNNFFESFDKKFSLLSQQKGNKKLKKKSDGKKVPRK